jgi:transcriptional regulator with XRE-family HTH domain
MSLDVEALLKRIEARRRELGLSEAELLRRSGLGMTFLKDMRSGRKQTLMQNNAAALATALHMSVSELTGEPLRVVADGRAAYEPDFAPPPSGEEPEPPRRPPQISVLIPEATVRTTPEAFEIDFGGGDVWPFSPRRLEKLGLDPKKAFVVEADGAHWLCRTFLEGESPYGLAILLRGNVLVARRLEPPWQRGRGDRWVRVIDPSGREPPEEAELEWLPVIAKVFLEMRSP